MSGAHYRTSIQELLHARINSLERQGGNKCGKCQAQDSLLLGTLKSRSNGCIVPIARSSHLTRGLSRVGFAQMAIHLL